ncbi:MAG: type IX secretion system PorP/SprF family membrane protein [Cyclobacteriaceae bacterium]|jgi:type IX secretion system PorP/SprF family membrane protein
MKNIKLILVSILMFSGLYCHGQQRAVQSTYMFNGLLINPAYAGSQNLFSATVTNRNQWVNVDGAPNSQSIAAHTSWKENQVGTGLLIQRDQIGVHEQYSVYGSYAYKIRTNAGILSMGLQGGFDSRSSNYSSLDWKDPSDPLNIDGTRFNPNFGAGLYFANRKFFAGLSVPYILQPKIFDVTTISSDAREARYYYLNVGNVMELSKTLKLNPSFLLRMQQQANIGYDINVNLIFSDIIYAGASYRSGGAVVFITQLVLNENFRIGYAYDAVTSAITGFTPGSHEIMLNYTKLIRGAKKDPLCPVYF